ncbi:MAG TPA: isoprenylcysteine carboxylmethyltransferase family protein [Phenylobacterium sp.]|jgi:methyltransferase
MTLSLVILALVTAQRLGELVIARRNTRRLLARGGVEHAPGHYPLIVVLHAAWLAGLWLLAWDRPPNLGWLAAYIGLQGLRAWVLLSLGARWTTRIVTVPGEDLVRRGPYRFVSHPNYLVVVGEIAVLPLVFGLPAYAAVFSLANAAVLWVRIRAENAALV